MEKYTQRENSMVIKGKSILEFGIRKFKFPVWFMAFKKVTKQIIIFDNMKNNNEHYQTLLIFSYITGWLLNRNYHILYII